MWLDARGLAMPNDVLLLDGYASDYAEELWHEGEGKQLLSDLISSLCCHLKFLKGHLPDAWAQYKTWCRLELPTRATPLTADMLLAMTGAAIENNLLSFGAALWLGFQAMLRTGELVKLRLADIVIDAVTARGVVHLGFTKGEANVAMRQSRFW